MTNEETFSLLTSDVLLELAVEMRERWEDVVRNGLTVSEKKQSESFSCLPFEQIQYCRDLAPKEPVLQAFHVLARWRWFCWYVGCTERKAIAALIAACQKAQVRVSGRLEQVNLLTTSLDYV